MKNLTFKVILSVFIAILITGCSSSRGQFLTEHSQGWFNSVDEDGEGGEGFVHCSVEEVVVDAGAGEVKILKKPNCIKAEFTSYDEEREKVAKEKRIIEKENKKKDR